jgi:diguanylate cyclase (GGDEF)-like protein
MSADTIFLYGKITRRIFVIFLVFALVPVSLLSWVAMDRISRATDQQVSKVLENEVKNFSYLILERLQFAQQTLHLYQAEQTLNSEQKFPSQMQTELARKGLLLARQPSDMLYDLPPARLEAAKARLAGGQSIALLQETDGQRRVYLAAALAAEDLAAGLVTARLDIDYVLRPQQSRNLTIESCILDAQYNILFATSAPLCLSFLDASANQLGHKGEVAFGADNTTFSLYRSLFMEEKFGVSSWKIVIIQPGSDIFSASEVFRNNFVLAALGVILSLSLVSIYFIRARMAPLPKIMAGIHRVSEKQYDQPVEVASGDEFEELADAFNSMSSQVSRQIITMASLAELDRIILTRIKREDLIRVVLEKTGDIIPHQGIAIAVLDKDKPHGQLYSLDDSGNTDFNIADFELDQDQVIALEDDSLWLASADGATTLFSAFPAHIDYLQLLPVHQENQLIAVLVLAYDQTPNPDAEDIFTARSYADRVAVALGNAEWEARLYHQAHYDTLTGLPNRLSLLDTLAQSIRHAERSQQPFAVLFFDLDDFKLVNDSLGHIAGDKMIGVIAQRLQECLRADDTVARMGGDEFVIVSSAFPSEQEAVSGTSNMAEKMMKAVALPLQISGRDIRASSSIGIAFYPKDGEDSDALLKNADTAMYHAKSQGRGNFQYFSEKLNAESLALMSLSTDIKRALEADEFELYYQPKIKIPGDRIIGAEALIRWNHPEKGMVSPLQFIEVAERMGLISAIGDWTLNEACRQIVLWQEAGVSPPRVSVNLSAIQIHQEDLPGKVMMLLQRYQIEPECLEIEIVEGVLVEDMEATSSKLKAVRELGVHIAIDDYGTGYSSLSYVKSFPVDTLKIDRCFITNICEDSADQAIVTSTIVLAHNLKMAVIAEGVETVEQAAMLLDLGCDQIQGYLFSRPVPADQFAALISADTALALTVDSGAA